MRSEALSTARLAWLGLIAAFPAAGLELAPLAPHHQPLNFNFSRNLQYGCTESSAFGPKEFGMEARLKDGRALSGTSQICREGFSSLMRVRIQDTIVTPMETVYLEANGLRGIPRDSGWIFPVMEGRISGFSLQPEASGKGYEYLQAPGGSPVRYSRKALREMVRGNREAEKLMRWKSAGLGIFLGSAMAAGGLFFAAANLPGEKHYENGNLEYTGYEKNAICVASGIGLLVTGGVFWLVTRNNDWQAINAFNKAE